MAITKIIAIITTINTIVKMARIFIMVTKIIKTISNSYINNC